MEQDELALIKAIESGDTDLGKATPMNLCVRLLALLKYMSITRPLAHPIKPSFVVCAPVYLVIFHLKRKLQLGEFFRIINNKPLACNLLEVYCKEQDKQMLRDFYYQDDRRSDSATVTILESFEEKVGWTDCEKSGMDDGSLFATDYSRFTSSYFLFAARMQDFNERLNKLKIGLKLYQEDKDRAFEAKACFFLFFFCDFIPFISSQILTNRLITPHPT